MIETTVEEAKRLLEESKYKGMGPFTYDKIATVEEVFIGAGYRAHRFKGQYHRHHFYVFVDGQHKHSISFKNEEDDEPLFS